MNFEDKNILITGGLGFIGSSLAHALVNLDSNITIVDCKLDGSGYNTHNIDGISDKVDLKISDIRDETTINKLVRDKDYIFNLAAQVSHLRSMEDPFLDFDINSKGQLILLEACRKFNDGVKIIYTGTRSQYGKADYLPVDEEHPLNPTDVNGINKTIGESYHLTYKKIYGIKLCSLRLTNTYGPRHPVKDPTQGFFGWFLRLALDNQKIKLFDGKQKRDFVYVDDVISALLLAVNADGIFNVGSGTGISIVELVEKIIATAGRGSYEIVPFPDERKIIEIGDYITDISKIKKLGWEPRVQLEDGLKRTIDFYEKNRSRYW